MIDGLVKSQKPPVYVIPAQAGIQGNQGVLDSRFRGSDGFGDFYEFIMIDDFVKNKMVNNSYKPKIKFLQKLLSTGWIGLRPKVFDDTHTGPVVIQKAKSL